MSGVSFLDLLDSSIRDSNKAAVDFGSLYRFLHALLTHLGIQDLVLGGSPGLLRDQTGDAGTDTGEAVEEVRSATHLPVPPLAQLNQRVQQCEDELSRVMVLFRDLEQHRSHGQMQEVMELQDQEVEVKNHLEQEMKVKELQEQIKEVKELQEQMEEVKELKEQMLEMKELQEKMEEMKELQVKMEEVKELQEKMEEMKELQVKMEEVKEVQEQMEETKGLQEKMEEMKDLQQQMKETCVTWDVLHASLLVCPQVSSRSEADATLRDFSPEPSDTCESLRSKDVTSARRTLESGSAESHQEATQTDVAAGPDGSDLSEQHRQTLEALRDIGGLRNQRLDQRVALLEEGKADQTQLTPLYQLISRGSLEAKQLIKDLDHQKGLIDDLKKQQMVLTQSLQDLEQKTTGRHVVDTEIKVDRMVLDSKVSRRDFDSVTEQLNVMFHELLNRVSGQEQNWQQLMERLSSEMDCKLNRLELDSVKRQLEERWKKIQSKLQAQDGPEMQDAAGLRKQLIDRFHCLSCDRPITKLSPGPRLVTLPSSPCLPSHKSIRPFTVYALEQFRHHYRSSDGVSTATELALRRGGRSHAAVTGVQRRAKQVKPQTEADFQSEEVDIVGLDGQVYRGRLNAPPTANPETKLPNISGKDVSSKSEDKSRTSTHRSALSPESRGSCGSARARSVLGCPSHNSILDAHAVDLLDPTPFQM